MRRDELMDGYVWLYEQCYGTEKLYERIERNWSRRTRSSNLFEKALRGVAARRRDGARATPSSRRHFKDGIKLMMRRAVNADAGQLLYLLDAYDFAVFLRRFSTPRRGENYRTFEDPSRWDRVPEGNASPETKEEVAKLNVMQWQNTKAVKRTKVDARPSCGSQPSGAAARLDRAAAPSATSRATRVSGRDEGPDVGAAAAAAPASPACGTDTPCSRGKRRRFVCGGGRRDRGSTGASPPERRSCCGACDPGAAFSKNIAVESTSRWAS